MLEFYGINTIIISISKFNSKTTFADALCRGGKHCNAREVDKAVRLNNYSIAKEKEDQQQMYLKLKYDRMVSIIFQYGVTLKEDVNSLTVKKKHL